MHTLATGTLLALFLTATPAPPARPPVKASVFPYALKTDRLKNGLTVVRVPYASPGLVAYFTVVRVGSRNEVEPGHTGFAHFFEHVMFKGTAKYPEGARADLLAKAGFDDNAFTTDDITVYHSVGPSSSLMPLIEVEADRFKNLSYSEQTFQTEAKAVLGEYHKSAARPELKMEEALLAKAFTQHPYQHTTLGFYDDIKKMPGYYEYSQQFFQRWYTPDNTMLFIVGAFDDAQVMKQIQAQYGDWKGQAAKVTIPQEPAQKELHSVAVEWPTPTLPRVLYAWRTPSQGLASRESAIQNVLVSYLVGPTSPLHKQLVLEQQLAESVGSWFSEHRDPQLFSIAADLKEEANRAPVKKAFDAAIADLVAGKVDPTRLENIKKNLRYSLTMDLETPKDVAEHLSWYAGVFGAPDALIRHYDNLSKVSAQEVVQFARKYLTEQNRTTLELTSKPATAAQDAHR